jgi:hypothetical protein
VSFYLLEAGWLGRQQNAAIVFVLYELIFGFLHLVRSDVGANMTANSGDSNSIIKTTRFLKLHPTCDLFALKGFKLDSNAEHPILKLESLIGLIDEQSPGLQSETLIGAHRRHIDYLHCKCHLNN